MDAPFFRFHLIDMARELDIEVGVPVSAVLPDDGEVFSGALPAGQYATVTHVGPPHQLVDVTAELLGWAQRRGLVWDMTTTPDGERWGCRLEIYRTGPREQPDTSKWETDLAFRLAD